MDTAFSIGIYRFAHKSKILPETFHVGAHFSPSGCGPSPRATPPIFFFATKPHPPTTSSSQHGSQRLSPLRYVPPTPGGCFSVTKSPSSSPRSGLFAASPRSLVAVYSLADHVLSKVSAPPSFFGSYTFLAKVSFSVGCWTHQLSSS